MISDLLHLVLALVVGLAVGVGAACFYRGVWSLILRLRPTPAFKLAPSRIALDEDLRQFAAACPEMPGPIVVDVEPVLSIQATSWSVYASQGVPDEVIYHVLSRIRKPFMATTNFTEN